MSPPQVAKDIMVTRLVTLSPDAGVFDAIARLNKAKITGAPVVSEDFDHIGVFSDKCCIRALAAHHARGKAKDPSQMPRAKDLMATKLVTLQPDMDVFDAIALLLRSRVSGAPVVDQNQRFVGVFSEKTSMSVLVTAAYEQLPNCHVQGFIDADRNRTIDEENDLWSICQIFLDTPYRRLPVLRDDRLVGQVSRRDLLCAAHALYAPNRPSALSGWGLRKTPETPEESDRVAMFMDTAARTIREDIDLFAIVQIFRESNYRRLPVVDGSKLVGQISRRDVLHAVNNMIQSTQSREKTLLYLSSLIDRQDAHIE